jgi:gas vesicle protein
MYYDESPQAFNFVAGFVMGVALGAGLALILAPQSGRRTRRRLAHVVAGARHVAGSQLEDWGSDVRSAVDAGRRRLKL